jgi:hypothetical protein
MDKIYQAKDSCAKQPPKVFISYSRESNRRMQQVRNLAQALRMDGIDCMIDQFIQSPSNWDRWMIDQIDLADYVLIVCSEAYYNSFRNLESVNSTEGVTWESTLIIEQLYKGKSSNDKFYPVFLDQPDVRLIPNGIRTSFFNLSTCDLSHILLDNSRLMTPGGYQDLYRLFTQQPSVIPRNIGSLQRLNSLSDDELDQESPSLTEIKLRKEVNLSKESTNLLKKEVQDNRKIGNYFEHHATINGSVTSNLSLD